MNQNYIVVDNWHIIEQGFDKERVTKSESLFSLGNGAMGQRANFEETYSGETFQGSYIGGIYYPDKTKVGWWKNGYPKYFAKVLNAPNWIGIRLKINQEELDLNTCQIRNFKRILNMKEGVYTREFVAVLPNQIEIQAKVTRFLSMQYTELGAIRYEVTPLNDDVSITFESFLDTSIKNNDANWEEKFWNTLDVQQANNKGFIIAETKKTAFRVCAFMENYLKIENEIIPLQTINQQEMYLGLQYASVVKKGQTACFEKFAGYVTSLNHPKEELIDKASFLLHKINTLGFDKLLKIQKENWAEIWKMADITIEGDLKAQQAIRFNIFQLNQTYSGKDPRLNIGPKGFTGEKYGGSTYWDTEAYCLPFYMVTKNTQVARNLLKYRYDQLPQAIENAEKLGFTRGAALYPMVTINGEECHNEWEITFEEIHRNGAIAFAIYNYVRYTGDFSYVPEMGLEVLIAIARFWHQRASYSAEKEQFVILGVTGPNEYENNINNNFYTNYIARWCIRYTQECLDKVKKENNKRFAEICQKTKLSPEEVSEWTQVADNLYFPYSKKYGVYLQQDGFLDKELRFVSELDPKERPLNQHWSWDRILRSPYIKQADTLQGFYFFEDHFTKEELERHFDFYEPLTLHESSLSPCIHSVLASSLGRMQQAYEFYLRTSRLDLDDYNKEVSEGLHITSMAGTWMSIVEGFGGLRVRNDKLHLTPQIPPQWEAYSFKINFRNRILHVCMDKNQVEISLDGKDLSLIINGKEIYVESQNKTIILINQ